MGKLKAWGNKFIAFLKKYGIDAILAILIFNFPMYAIAFIDDAGFQAFGLWWMALWWGLGPLTPGWLVTILLAVFIKWLRSGIWKGILWLREAIDKLQLQNQLAAYLTAEEINMVLEMAKKVSAESDKKKKAFLDLLRRERMKMIDDQWTKEVNQKEEKNGK
jgi:ABC-type multidrug transport system fused ATPase/permease subunit